MDDNRDAADSQAMLLRMWGHQARAVYSAAEALKEIRNMHPDVAILDLGMPQINGWELAQRLRREADESGITLIALSGFDEPEDRLLSRWTGFAQHFVKPVDPQTLEHYLESIPEHHHDNN
ncbi:MAG: response regulator [Gemmataceae bacterium]|nr:response regulator [Gemmataceae bacterium]